MILSNEPGFYAPGEFGIRLENLVLVQPASVSGTKRFFAFETLTWVPFDRVMIQPDLLTATERAWLDAYHARVHTLVSPLVPQAVRDWLADACAPLEHTP